MEVFCAAVARHREYSSAQARRQYTLAFPWLLQPASPGSSSTPSAMLPIDRKFEHGGSNHYPSKRRRSHREDKRGLDVCTSFGRTCRALAFFAALLGMAVLLWQRAVAALPSGTRGRSPHSEDPTSLYCRRWSGRGRKRRLLHVQCLALQESRHQRCLKTSRLSVSYDSPTIIWLHAMEGGQV